jgi:hypothetical protein
MSNGLRSFTGVSAANTAKTHTITLPKVNVNSSKLKKIFIRSLTISTSGADPANDITVAVNDNGSAVWSVELRAAQIFGGHFKFDNYPIVIRDGNLTIVTDAAGAGCLVTVSAVYTVR